MGNSWVRRMIRIRTYLNSNKKNYIYTVSVLWSNKTLNWITYSFFNGILVESFDASHLELAGQNHLQATRNLRNKYLSAK